MRAWTGTQRQAAEEFAAMAVATVALVLLGVSATVVGILLLALEGVPWLIPAGCALLLGGGAAGWAAFRRLLGLKKALEAPRRRNRVFISYRTAEHAAAAERVAEALREEGVGVFFARPGDVVVHPSQPPSLFSAFRAIGLFQMGELDAELQQALIDSDAMVYFVPTTRRRLAVWQTMKDQFDAFGSWLLFLSGLSRTTWRFFWYLGVYGVALAPAQRLLDLSSWQAWELAVARQLGLVVVKLRAGPEPMDGADEELVTYREETFEHDFRTNAVPRLRREARAEPEVRGFLPPLALIALGGFTLFAAGALSLLAVGLFFLVRSLL